MNAQATNMSDNDFQALVHNVLMSDTQFGKELQDIIKNIITSSSNSILDEINKFKAKDGGEISLGDVFDLSKSDADKARNDYKEKQNTLLGFIGEVSDNSAWDYIKERAKSGFTITDIFGFDEKETEDSKNKFKDEQKKILDSLEKNIPTKANMMEALIGKPEKITALEDSEDISDNTGGMVKKTIDDVTSKTKFKDDPEQAEVEEFHVDEPTPVHIMGIDTPVLKELSDIFEGLKVEDKPEEEEGPGFFKRVLQFAGLAAFAALATYLAKNPEVWEDTKDWFKNTLIPWFKEDLPKLWDDFGKVVYNTLGGIGDTFSNIGKAAQGELVDVEARGWWNRWIVTPFLVIGQGLGYAAWYVTEFIHDWVVVPFIKFGQHVGEGAYMIWEWINENVIQRFVRFGQHVGEGAYMIWEWIDEKVIQRFVQFGQHVGEGAHMIWEWIDEKVIQRFVRFGERVGEGAHMIWEWIDENVFQPFRDFGTFVMEGATNLSSTIKERVIDPFLSFFTMVWDSIKNMTSSIRDTVMAIPNFVRDAISGLRDRLLPWRRGGKSDEEKAQELQEQIQEEQQRIERSEAGERQYRRGLLFGDREEEGREESQERIDKWEDQLRELNPGGTEVISGEMEDGIVSDGKFMQYAKGDVAAAIDMDALMESGRNSEMQMNKLNDHIERMNKKFDDLIHVSTQILKKPTQMDSGPEPMPSIPGNIAASRGFASDDIAHRTRVWEILHGYS